MRGIPRVQDADKLLHSIPRNALDGERWPSETAWVHIHRLLAGLRTGMGLVHDRDPLSLRNFVFADLKFARDPNFVGGPFILCAIIRAHDKFARRNPNEILAVDQRGQ